MIDIEEMMIQGAANSGPPTGELLWEGMPGNIALPYDFTFRVPDGVTSISVLCRQAGAPYSAASGMPYASEVRRYTGPGTLGPAFVRAQNGSNVGDVAFNGGSGVAGLYYSNDGYGDVYGGGSGGGAAGYGADGNTQAGGAGGAGAATSNYGKGPGGGGGGMYGVGASGANGTSGSPGGKGGSGGSNGLDDGLGTGGSYGGGCGADWSYSAGNAGFAGGALAYVNNIAVTPGDLLYLSPASPSQLAAGLGAIRIMWGGGRSFPSNAAYVGGTYAAWSPGSTSGAILANVNRYAHFTLSGFGFTVANKVLPATGKKYWECHIHSAVDSNLRIGVAQTVVTPGTTGTSLGYDGTGAVYMNNGLAASLAGFGNGDVIGVVFDPAVPSIAFYKNNVYLNAISLPAGTYYPALGGRNGARSTTLFGEYTFYTPPAGTTLL